MDWWILEVIFVVVMLAVLAGLGPLIKRFGRAYAADVFQVNPRTGKSYLVLMDIAYYMIFGAYVLFVIKWEPDTEWSDEVNAAQLQASVVRLGGMVLLMGLLHGLNVLSLPLIGRVFTLNRQLDQELVGGSRQPGRAPEHPEPDRDAGVVDISRRGEVWQRPTPSQRAE
jgi:hypothetical protein